MFVFLHVALCMCVSLFHSSCSRGASPTAADESTFQPAFSLPRPRDGPQDQTGGQHPCPGVTLQMLPFIHALYE